MTFIIKARIIILLGDFNETFGYGSKLSDSDSKKLISDSLEHSSSLDATNT